MQQRSFKKSRIFLSAFESVLLASFQLLYITHLMTCHCGHGMHGTGCAVDHVRPGSIESPLFRADIEIPGDSDCPAESGESHDPESCPVCRLFANLSRMLPSEPAKVSYYHACRGEAAMLPSPGVYVTRPSTTPARAPPLPPIS